MPRPTTRRQLSRLHRALQTNSTSAPNKPTTQPETTSVISPARHRRQLDQLSGAAREDAVLQLQRQRGNAYVQNLLQRQPTTATAPVTNNPIVSETSKGNTITLTLPTPEGGGIAPERATAGDTTYHCRSPR